MTDITAALEKLLDAHAEVYARATMQYLTNKLTEDERDKEWHHSDLKTKHAIQALIQVAVVEIEHYYSHKASKQAGYAMLHWCACGKSDVDRDRLLRHIRWQELKLQLNATKGGAQ